MKSRTRSATAVAALTMLATFTAACSDDGDTGAAEATTPDDGATDDAGSAVDGDCHGTDLDFTNLETGVSGTATTALATSQFGGGTYIAHAADFDLTEEDLESWRPDVPDGDNVITIQLTVFNAEEDPAPVQPNTAIQWTTEPGELTFGVRHFTTDEDWSETHMVNDDDRPKTMTITGIGDTFCFEIDFADDQKEISGTVEAPVFEHL